MNYKNYTNPHILDINTLKDHIENLKKEKSEALIKNLTGKYKSINNDLQYAEFVLFNKKFGKTNKSSQRKRIYEPKK